MAVKKPLVLSSGKTKEIAATDSIRDVGLLSSLTTTDKTSTVNAINEVLAGQTAGNITINQRINSAAANFCQSII